MKNLFFVLMCLFTIVANAQTLSEYPNFERYQKENTRIIQEKSYPKVIFIGNSITDGWARMRPDFFASHQFLGRGISGQTSPQLLLRFQKDVIALRPKAVIINIGTNDIAENTGKYNLEYTISNIKSMVELAKANKIKVYLSSVLPVDVYPWRKEITNAVALVRQLNERIRQLAKEKRVPYIDYFSQMSKPNGGMIEEYTKDGVHPTLKGYEVMEKIVLSIL